LSEASTSNRPVVLHARVVTGTGGGPDKTILNSPQFLRDLGYDSLCAYLHPPNDPGFEELKQRAASLNAELISVPDRGIKDLSVISRMLKICRERNVSIWHGHDYKSDALGLLLRKFHPMKLVSTVHGWGVKSKKTPLYHAVDRFSLKSYDRVICVSDKLLSECLDAGVPIGNLCEIDNAIDLSSYNSLPEKREARTGFGINPENPVVVAVGRLSKEKAFDVLIQAFADLLATGLDATLLIAGDGPEHEALQNRIASHGVKDSVQLIGHVADPRDVYAAADVFALSSTSEGLPNSLIEAMACGVPVVATAVGAVPSVVTDESNGLLCPAGDASSLTLALNRLLSNEPLRDQFSAAARNTIENRYSFVRRMLKIAAVYDSVLIDRHSTDDSQPFEPTAAERRQHLASGVSPRIADPPGCESREAATAISTVAPRVNQAIATDHGIRVELTSTPEIWHDYLNEKGCSGFYQQAAWLRVLQNGLGHQPVCLQATSGSELVGVLPMAFVKTPLFGRFLVSLPYLNSSGIVAETPEAASALVDRAINFAEQLDVRYLELRHETATDHPKLTEAVTDKVHMRLALPETTDELW
jgi:glycosyltransferase involved in cell wall biosynthesis